MINKEYVEKKKELDDLAEVITAAKKIGELKKIISEEEKLGSLKMNTKKIIEAQNKMATVLREVTDE